MSSLLSVRVLHVLTCYTEYMFLDVSVSGIRILANVCYRASNIKFLSEFEKALHSHITVMF